MQTMLQAISNPTRRRILQLVWEQELPAREIADQFSISWPAVSQNLRILKNSELLEERRSGVKRFYRVNQSKAKPIAQLLQAMWQEDLQTLKDIVEGNTDD